MGSFGDLRESLRDRQPNGKGTALINDAENCNVSVVIINDPFGDTQSQAHARDIEGANRLATIELLKIVDKADFELISSRSCALAATNSAVRSST